MRGERTEKGLRKAGKRPRYSQGFELARRTGSEKRDAERLQFLQDMLDAGNIYFLPHDYFIAAVRQNIGKIFERDNLVGGVSENGK